VPTASGVAVSTFAVLGEAPVLSTGVTQDDVTHPTEIPDLHAISQHRDHEGARIRVEQAIEKPQP
jgi:hypothetical protein